MAEVVDKGVPEGDVDDVVVVDNDGDRAEGRGEAAVEPDEEEEMLRWCGPRGGVVVEEGPGAGELLAELDVAGDPFRLRTLPFAEGMVLPL